MVMIEDRTMPPLNNPRHERFAQEGRTEDESYVLAGYKANDGNCIRLKGNERVQARLIELQAAAAKASEVTVETLLAELEAARARADSLEQLSAAVKAIDLKAKVSGVMVQRIEVGGPKAFDDCQSMEDLMVLTCEQLRAEGYNLDDADKAALTELLLRQQDEQEEFLASCKAKVIAVRYASDPVELRHRQKLAAERQRQREQRLIASPH
jgi:hypothetical protein